VGARCRAVRCAYLQLYKARAPTVATTIKMRMRAHSACFTSPLCFIICIYKAYVATYNIQRMLHALICHLPDLLKWPVYLPLLLYILIYKAQDERPEADTYMYLYSRLHATKTPARYSQLELGLHVHAHAAAIAAWAIGA
jgi:hypothetical protein